MKEGKVFTKVSTKTDTLKGGPEETKKSTKKPYLCPYDMTEEWLFFSSTPSTVSTVSTYEKKPRYREEPGEFRE